MNLSKAFVWVALSVFAYACMCVCVNVCHIQVEEAKAGDKCVFTGCLVVVPDVGSMALPSRVAAGESLTHTHTHTQGQGCRS